MQQVGSYVYHVVAVCVVAVWGLTFISTKVLIGYGLTPQEIFFLRFLIAYVGIWFISPRKWFADRWQDELLLLAGGVTGGSLYFLTENTALGITLATNVAFIVCTAPLITTLLTLLFYRSERGGRWLWLGSVLALLGVGLVVCNGRFVLKLSPVGDLLSLTAAFSWAFYSLIMKRLSSRYPTVFLTRKIFFYGVLTILPVFAVRPWSFPLEGFLQVPVLLNLLFLSVLASLVCYAVWNVVLKQLGTVRASNYIYLNPLFTLVGSVCLLGERFTWMALLGVSCILLGVYCAEKRR